MKVQIKVKLLTLFLLSLAICSAHGQVIEKIKGKTLLVNGQDAPLNEGDEFYAIDENEHKTARIRIKKVRANKAIATLVKGKATAGEKLIARDMAASANKDNSDSERHYRLGPEAGILLGYSLDSMSFPAGDSNTPPLHVETANFKGNTFKVKGIYDWPFDEDFGFLFMAGLDGFNGSYAAQSSVINKNNSSTSTVSVSNLAFEGEAMWNFYHEGLDKAWLGVGYSFQYTLSSSSNLYSLQLNSSYSNAVMAGAGGNFALSNTSFIPLAINYYYYFAGTGISQSSINFMAGYGWTL